MNAYTTAQKVLGLVKEEFGAQNVPKRLREDIRTLIKRAVPSEKWCKGDYIDDVIAMNNDDLSQGKRIKVIDIAIPYGLQKSLNDIGVDSRMFVSVYYMDDEVEYLDISGLWATMQNVGRLS
jgi:hypothetical protein